MPENETITETTETPDPNKINAVGTFQGGKFVPYGYAGFADTGTPVYIFNTEDDYNAVADTLPDPSVIITLDDLDTGGFKFDSELNDESENAVQNKVIKAALDALRKNATGESPGLVQFTQASDVTEVDSGLGLSAVEKNAAVEGSLANKVESLELKNFAETILKKMSGSPGLSAQFSMDTETSYIIIVLSNNGSAMSHTVFVAGMQSQEYGGVTRIYPTTETKVSATLSNKNVVTITSTDNNGCLITVLRA